LYNITSLESRGKNMKFSSYLNPDYIFPCLEV